LQAINFVNATIIAQLQWGAIWYINAANSHLKQIEGIISSSYKLALGLPKKSANKVCWKFLDQISFNSKIAQTCDRYLCTASSLGKNKIINKIKFIWDKYESGRIFGRKIPLLVSRWHVVEPLLKSLSKFKMHPQFTFPFKEKYIHSEFDFMTGKLAKESNDPGKLFVQLTKEAMSSPEEIAIYTDGSRTVVEDTVEGGNLVGCAVLAPHIDKSYIFKLNPMTSSFTAEVLAIDKALQLMDTF